MPNRRSVNFSRVIVLDPSAAAEVVGAMTPGASTPPEAAAGGDAITVTRAQEEQDGPNEQGGPRTPAEPEGVAADGGGAAVGQEGVPCLDEGGCHERDGDGVEEQGDQCHEPRDRSTQAAATGEEAREEGEHVEEQSDQVEDPAKAPHVIVVFGGRVPSEAPAVRVSCCHAPLLRSRTVSLTRPARLEYYRHRPPTRGQTALQGSLACSRRCRGCRCGSRSIARCRAHR